MADRIDDGEGRAVMSGLGNALVVPGDWTPGSVTPLAAEGSVPVRGEMTP